MTELAAITKGKCGRRGLPLEIRNAIIADYLRLRSCAKTAKLWARTRQSIHDIVARRKHTYKRRLHDEPVIYRGEKFTPGKDGYLRRTVRRGHDTMQLHRIMWQDAHGPIPTGHNVRFKDGDKLNCTIENLECLPIAEISRRTSPRINQFTKLKWQKLAESMRLFIIKESNKFAQWFHGDTVELQQIGHLAALKSARRYDPALGAGFYGYSHREIRGAMMRHASAAALPVHVPDAKRKAGGFSSVSIDAPVGDDADGATWGDLNLSAEESTTDEIDSATRAATLAVLMKRLPKRERQILRARFFDNRTLEDVATEMNLTRERIRQIEAATLRKLSRSRNLKKVAA